MSKRLSDIGEFGLIKRISQKFNPGTSVIKGIGDDCAVLRYTKNKYLLFTTDMIIEDIHFKKDANPQDIGHKALAVNISDIAACGGVPRWAVVSLGIPSECRYSYVNNIYRGMIRLADKFNIDIVGGDTNLSKKIVISVALLGEVDRNKLVLRSGALDKDIILLTGLLAEKPDDLNFMPHLEQSQYIVKNFGVTSMIDISDGFFQDLNHILCESRKSAIVYESLIPCLRRRRSIKEVLNTGEQFKLIFTMPRREAARLAKGYYPVGEIIDNKDAIVYVTKNGRREKITPRGYTHFQATDCPLRGQAQIKNQDEKFRYNHK